MEKLSKLKASFKENGTVTAGNASGMNDASSGVILAAEDKARELGLPILGRILATATVGVDPDIMGIGPVGATRKAMEKAGLTLDQLDRIELNEAFAAQYLACEKELGLNREITNVHGSGISLGHPVGATGTRLITTLLYELKHTGGRYGLVTICAGGGMGVAFDALKDTYAALGATMPQVHRIAAIAAGTLDTLPHQGAQITLLGICKMTHKEAYFDIMVTQIIIPFIACFLFIGLSVMGLC